MAFEAIAAFFQKVGEWYAATKWAQTAVKIAKVLTAVMGVKGFMQAKNMLAKGQDILGNKTSAGGKIPVIYGNRRVGTQIIYMDTNANDSRDLYVVYALAVGECEEILGKTIELDGNPLTDSARFRDGGYIGSDKINSGSGSLNTVSQNGTGINAGAGGFGTSPTSKYRYVFNLHHGAATQTADPMLVASMSNWTSAHKLNGVCYIAAHYGYDKEGIWSGVPQLTVQVKGKKVFDPRDAGQTFGTVSTYEWSDNPALCFLDYITNTEYGKGLPIAKINTSTFESAANTADTLVDPPFHNGSAQALTWSGDNGNDFISVLGTNANTDWFQNKIGEQITLVNSGGTTILNAKNIKDVQRDEFFDASEDYRVYVDDTLGADYSSNTGTYLLKVKRFHCNGYLDCNKTVMENAKELLANMRGIFLYVDGKYELQIEDTGSSTFSITDNHIIADAGITVDYGNKDQRANKVVIEFFNGNKKYELDTATILHSATTDASDFTSDDGGEELEVKAEFPYVTDPYIAHNMGKAILTRSRNQTTIQFLGTSEMYKLNVGDIVDFTYAGLGFGSKVCRVEALELQSDGLVSVGLIEYFDVYTWEVPAQEPVEELANLPSAYAVKAPTGLAFTDTDASSTGRPFLSWNEPTDFPNYQYRVNVVDSSGNQVVNKIVDVENCDLNFIPKGTNYVASVSSLNPLGSESTAATLTFTVGDEPTVATDIKDGSITSGKIADDAVTTAKIIDDAVTNALIATDAVNQDSIAANAVTASEIVAGTITTSEIASSTIVAGNIASGTLTSASGVFGTISANDVTTGTLNASNVAVTNLNADNITTGTLNADNIQIDDVTIDSDGSGNLIVKSGGVGTTQIADDAVTDAKVSNLSANSITSDTLDSARINTNTLNVKHFDNVSTDIKSHLATETFMPLLRYGSAIRGAGGSTIYTGSNDSFVPVTITSVRDNATYTAVLSAVLGDVNGGRVQYSLDNSNWTDASGGETNIYWSAGTYRGYVYMYQGQITTLSDTQSTVYWRVYFSGTYNHTHMQLHVTLDNTT
ncbi:MAG: hypothetical protein CMC22_00320 [Flavobacteriaceae bacterium]|nr:hypothetical protein [Flavobacteriaceae bacterium]|tara:strand:+ start:5785 stop:8910 length:3126 start_codon:yes stop_codon:yes gene_type:complete